MPPRPPSQKRNQAQPASGKPGQDKAEKTWLRRFWVVLSLFLVIGVSLMAYTQYQAVSETEREAYITVEARTQAGDKANVLCKLSLLIDPAQESPLKDRQPQLNAVVSSTLSEIYQSDTRPTPTEVRQILLDTLNKKLPQKLQIRDIFIQDLVVGSS